MTSIHLLVFIRAVGAAEILRAASSCSSGRQRDKSSWHYQKPSLRRHPQITHHLNCSPPLPGPFYCNLKTLQQFISKHSATVGRTTAPSGPGSGSCDWLWVRGGRQEPPSKHKRSFWCLYEKTVNVSNSRLLSSPLLTTTISGSLRFLWLNLKLLPVLPVFLLFQFVVHVKGSRKKRTFLGRVLSPASALLCSLNEPDVTRLMLWWCAECKADCVL